MTAPTKKRVNSRQKGKRGELQLAKALTELGHPARRGQQFAGGKDSPDVVCESLSAWHIECKVTATCQMFSPAQVAAWEAQARRDAGNKYPAIMHRWNGARSWWVRVFNSTVTGPYWQTLEEFLTDWRGEL